MITWKEYVEQYQPIKNHLVTDAPFDGYMYETFGEEVEYVLSLRNTRNVWAIIEDDGYKYVIPGYYYIAPLGYIITEKPWENNRVEVTLNPL
jgi:hypothetical protein